MLLTREQIQQKLNKLERSLPQLIKDHEDRADFLCAFAGEADEITENVSAADDVWAGEQLDRMLKANGFSPEDEIPCDG
jgi:hypothetical protein